MRSWPDGGSAGWFSSKVSPVARVSQCVTTSTVPAVRFDDLVGQSPVIDSLRVAVRAATIRGGPVGHTLLTGSAGLGKTSLAEAMAAERGVALHRTTAIHA